MQFFKIIDSEGTFPTGSYVNGDYVGIVGTVENPIGGALQGWYILAQISGVAGEGWAVLDTDGAPYASQTAAQDALDDLIRWVSH